MNSTIVRFIKLNLLRMLFKTFGMLMPLRVSHCSADLFCTPWIKRTQRTDQAHGADCSTLQIDDQTLATYVWGDPLMQPYILFAHGWSSHGLRHCAWVEAVRSSGYALVAFDQQAHGRSSGRIVTLLDFARNLVGVGHRYGPAAAVVGHSLGGAAVTIAMNQGLQAARAVLIAPLADPSRAATSFARHIGMSVSLRRRMIALLERRTGVAMEALQAHRQAPALACPALTVHDLEDREVPWADGERYARYWPQSRLLSTTGLGHHRIARDPAVIAAVLEFLRGETVGNRVVSSPNLPFGLA